MVRHRYRDNPPWTTRIITAEYEKLPEAVPEAWLPRIRLNQLASVVKAEIKEYGCGVYGCVFPTYTPNIVVKVTTDDTEAEFAERLADTLVAPICTKYYAVVRTGQKHTIKKYGTYDVFMLWRDSAEHVGELDKFIDDDEMNLFSMQHVFAEDSYRILNDEKRGRRKAGIPQRELRAWEEAMERVADGVPALARLAAGMLKVYREQRIFFGDVHAGNVGQVGGEWVITDPGHVAVIGSA